MKYCKSVELDILQPLSDSATFFATVNESGDEQVVTDIMIQRACEQADDMQIWPYSVAANAWVSNTVSMKARKAARSAVIIPFPT